MKDTRLMMLFTRSDRSLGSSTRRALGLGLALALTAFATSRSLVRAKGEGGGQVAREPNASTFFEEDHASVSWTGSWSTKALAANGGGRARLAMDPGAQVTFGFTGDSVTWIGYRDEWSGIAKVSVDGTVRATVDTYANPAAAKATLYTVDRLGGGPHTLTIQTTGTHNPASAGSWIWVDGFSVTQNDMEEQASARGYQAGNRSNSEPRRWDPKSLDPKRPDPATETRRGGRGPRSGNGRTHRDTDEATRIDRKDAGVTWTGAWSTNQLNAHIDGSARLSMEPTAKVTVAFTGTGVKWIGYRDEWSGIAEVFLDGRLRATVDTYSTPARAQAVLYAVDGLQGGAHTLVIQPTGRRHTASAGSWIWVDAISITR